MRLLPVLLAAEVLSLAAFAQESAAPAAASTQPPPAAPRAARSSNSSPEIHEDRKVTFRLTAPDATEVTVAGQSIGRNPLTKGEKGVWSVTVGPVEPGVWEYSLYVNGVQMIDPGNPDLKPQPSPRTSILHIPSNPPQPWDFQQIPHGTLHRHQFSSSSLGRMREFLVYTPPGYELEQSARFPVLYLIHGFSDNQDSWSGHGKAHWILDSLIAQGKVTPMIVVMPDGHPVPPGGGPREDYWKSNSEAFEHELVKEIVPMIDRHYRTKAEAPARAVAGLSMGGGHSLHTGLRHLQSFGSIGAFSAAVPGKEQVAEQFAKPQEVNQQLKLLWIACGKKDFLLERNRQFISLLKEQGIQHQWLETEGDHSWPVWRDYLTQFTPLLFKEAAQ
ncbi:MAG: esterase [Chthoniobacteraceae bacterium]